MQAAQYIPDPEYLRITRRFIAGHRHDFAERVAGAMPASLEAHLLAGWDARTHTHPLKNPVRDANQWLNATAADLKAARYRAAYDEEAIRDYAENYSACCGRMLSLTACRKFGAAFGVLPPQVRKLTEAGERARWVDSLWWRRQLRKVWTRESENAMRSVGIIRKGKQPYASDEAVKHRAIRAVRTREWMESRVMVNGEGEQLELLKLAEKSLANPALRRGEFMCRMRGFEETARDHGHVALFFTLTAPSAFHAHHAGGGVNEAWDKAARPGVRAGQQWLCKMWARARAKLARLSILYYGFRVAEPHHDGTPHWHMVLFVPAGAADILARVLHGVWLSEFSGEPGAAEFRSKCVTIEPGKGSATGYVAKYVSKNIDGAGAIGDEISDETGQAVSEGVRRVAAWAATHGIRQFQQIGGPLVSVWREARRRRDPVEDVDIERVRNAADSGDWRGYIRAQCFNGIAGGRRGLVKLARQDAERMNGICREAVYMGSNSYGEERQPGVIGLRCTSVVVITRPHRWRIEKKCNTASQLPGKPAADGGRTSGAPSTTRSTNSQSGGSRSTSAHPPGMIARSDSFPALGSRSDLGPVAITVRSDGAPEIGAPEAWTSRETSTAGPESWH